MQDFMIKGEVFTVEVAVAICPTCLTIVPYDRLDRAQRLRACDAYRTAHGLLTGSQIVSIRNVYGVSQRGMARLLGWGPITIHRYEQGGIQNRAHDTALRAVAKDPSLILRRLEAVREGLSAAGFQMVQECVARGARSATRVEVAAAL